MCIRDRGNQGDFIDPKNPHGRNGQAVALNNKVEGCKPKDMIGIPWMLAFALRDTGWYPVSYTHLDVYKRQVVNLMEGYGNDNPGAKSQGIKQLMAGGGVVLIGTTLIPLLSGLFG